MKVQQNLKINMIRARKKPNGQREYDIIQGNKMYFGMDMFSFVFQVIPLIEDSTIILTGENPAQDLIQWQKAERRVRGTIGWSGVGVSHRFK